MFICFALPLTRDKTTPPAFKLVTQRGRSIMCVSLHFVSFVFFSCGRHSKTFECFKEIDNLYWKSCHLNEMKCLYKQSMFIRMPCFCCATSRAHQNIAEKMTWKFKQIDFSQRQRQENRFNFSYKWIVLRFMTCLFFYDILLMASPIILFLTGETIVRRRKWAITNQLIGCRI